jgi:hypothetical protein
LFEAAVRQLASEGWQSSTVELQNPQGCYLRATRGDARLEIFNARGAGFRSGPDSDGPLEFVIHYRQPFSRAEREAALERLLTGSVPVETLQLFARMFTPSQRDRFYARLEMNPASSPEGYLSLARMHLQRKETNNAVRRLIGAKALLATLTDPSKMESQIDAIAKEISPRKPLTLTVTAQTYRDLGFLEITHAPQSLSVDKDVNDPLALFSIADGAPRTLCLRLQPGPGANSTSSFQWSCIQTQPQTRSISSSGFDLARRPTWEQTFSHHEFLIKLTVASVNQGAQLRYTVQVEPASGPVTSDPPASHP